MEYWDKEANEGNGDNRRLKGNDIGKFKCNKSLGDSSSPIDSFRAWVPNGTFSGWINLYRMVDVTIS